MLGPDTVVPNGCPWLAAGADGCCADVSRLGLYKQGVLATLPGLTLHSDRQLVRKRRVRDYLWRDR